MIGLLVGVTPGSASAVSVTKAQAAKVTKAINSILTNLENQALQAKDDLDASLDATQKQYDADMKKANDDYQQSLLAVNSKYQAQKAVIQNGIDAANRSNEKLIFKVMVNNLSLCHSKPKGDCAFGDLLIWGDETKYNGIPQRVGFDNGGAEGLVKGGGVVCLDEPTRLLNRSIIASNTSEIPIVDGKWNTEVAVLEKSILAKRNQYREGQQSAELRINAEYEDTVSIIEENKILGLTASIASIRAEKDFATFDQAFITAYEFQENLENLQAIADAPIIATILTLGFGNLVKVTKMLSQGNTVSDRYTFKGAAAFNKTVGKVFVTKSAFRARIKDAQSVYVKLLPKGTVKAV